jgi:hypothetical protein
MEVDQTTDKVTRNPDHMTEKVTRSVVSVGARCTSCTPLRMLSLQQYGVALFIQLRCTPVSNPSFAPLLHVEAAWPALPAPAPGRGEGTGDFAGNCAGELAGSPAFGLDPAARAVALLGDAVVLRADGEAAAGSCLQPRRSASGSAPGGHVQRRAIRSHKPLAHSIAAPHVAPNCSRGDEGTGALCSVGVRCWLCGCDGWCAPQLWCQMRAQKLELAR